MSKKPVFYPFQRGESVYIRILHAWGHCSNKWSTSLLLGKGYAPGPLFFYSICYTTTANPHLRGILAVWLVVDECILISPHPLVKCPLSVWYLDTLHHIWILFFPLFPTDPWKRVLLDWRHVTLSYARTIGWHSTQNAQSVSPFVTPNLQMMFYSLPSPNVTQKGNCRLAKDRLSSTEDHIQRTGPSWLVGHTSWAFTHCENLCVLSSDLMASPVAGHAWSTE
jgi:hypothetical protein